MDIDVTGIAVEALQNTSTLVDMDKRAWTTTIVSQTVTKEVARAHQLQGRAGQYRVNLANGPLEIELRELTRIQSRAYHHHLRMTTPWGGSTYRRLPNTQLLDYMQAMQGYTDELNAAKARIQPMLPALIQKAITLNNGLCSVTDYPSPAALLDKYSMEWDYDPIADAEAFRQLPEGFSDVFTQKYQTRVQERFRAGVDDRLTAIAALVSDFRRIVESDKPKFYQSTLDKLSDYSASLAALNITNDENLQNICEALAVITGFTAKQYASSESACAAARGACRRALTLMGKTETAAPAAPTPEPAPEVQATTAPSPVESDSTDTEDNNDVDADILDLFASL